MITQKGVGEYFEDYPTFVYKADVGGFHQKKSVYIATWVKTAFVTQCTITITIILVMAVLGGGVVGGLNDFSKSDHFFLQNIHSFPIKISMVSP